MIQTLRRRAGVIATLTALSGTALAAPSYCTATYTISNSSSNQIGFYNATTNSIVPLFSAASTNSNAITQDPTTAFIYYIDRANNSVHKLDVNTGTDTTASGTLNPAPLNIIGGTTDAAGNYYVYSSEGKYGQVNLSTGAIVGGSYKAYTPPAGYTLVSTTAGNGDFSIDASGQAYVVAETTAVPAASGFSNGPFLWKLNFATGNLTAPVPLKSGATQWTGSANGLAVDPTTGSFRISSGTGPTSGAPGLYSLNPTTGATALLTAVSGLTDLGGCPTLPDRPTATKSFSPGTVTGPSATSTLTITLGNTNLAPLYLQSALTDTLPTTPGAMVVASPNNLGGTCTTVSGNTVTATAGSGAVTLAAGGKIPPGGCTITLSVQVSAAGTYTNSIAAGALDTTAGSNAAAASANLVVTPSADLAITKTGPSAAVSGTTISYTLTVTNNGPSAANGATFADNMPNSLTGVTASCQNPLGGAGGCSASVGSGNNVTGSVTTLPSGGSVQVLVSGTVPAGATASLSNFATVAAPSGTTDPSTANNTSATVTTTLSKQVDLSVTKTDGQTSVTAGQTLTYTIVVANAGPSSSTGSFADTSFSGVTLSNWRCSATTGTASCPTGLPTTGGYSNGLLNVPANSSITLLVDASVTASSGSVSNTASITAPGGVTDTDTSNNSATDTDSLVFGISGTVFEDLGYAGGAGRNFTAASGVGRPGVRVELYSSLGLYLNATTTDASGRYSFLNLVAGSYTVRVVNSTVSSSRGTNTGTTYTPLAVQTFRVNAGADDTARVGGENPAIVDAGSNTVAGTLSTLLGASSTAQSISSVTVGGASASSGVDFGFNFDTVVNTNDTGQGSLRQFIQNADALSGADSTVFMVPDGAAHPGLRAGLTNQLTGGVAVITPASALPAITDASTTIDGGTQTTNVGNTNSGLLGTGGTVGVDALSLSQVNRPEVQIVGTSAILVGLDLQASSATVRGLSIYGFGSTANNNNSANIRLGNDFTNDLIEQNFVGISATRAAFDCPSATASGTGDNVRSAGADSGTLRNNLIGCAAGKGFGVESTSNSWTITGNEIRGNGIGNNNLDGIDLEGGSASATVSGNLIVTNGGVGVDSYSTGGGHTISNNSIQGNSTLNGETANIRLMGTGNTVYRNLLQNTVNGPGVMVVGGNAPGGVASSGNKISQNRFGGNAANAIDLLVTGSNISKGDGITLNDGGAGNLCGYLTTSGDKGLDYPTITSAVLASSGGATTVKGTACPNSSVEVYSALSGTGDTSGGTSYGEGVSYLGVATTDASGNWSLTLSGLSRGAALTSIVIDAGNNTSEFSGNLSVSGLASVTLTKLVRNIGTNLASSTGTFSNSAAAGKPGEYLEYCLAYTNTGSGNAAGLVISDVISALGPANLDGYGSGQGILSAPGATLVSGSTAAPSGSTLSSASDADAGSLSATSLNVNVGTLAPGAQGVVCFKAQVP